MSPLLLSRLPLRVHFQLLFFSFNVQQHLTCTFLYLFKHWLLKPNWREQKLDSFSNWSDLQNPLHCFSPESMWESPLPTRRHVPSSLHQGEVQVQLCTYLQWRSLSESKWVNDKRVKSCYSYPSNPGSYNNCYSKVSPVFTVCCHSHSELVRSEN